MFKLYSLIDTHDIILECWSSSTKHPDSRFFFSDFEKSPLVEDYEQIVPWIFECASKMTWPQHAYKLAEWGCQLYRAGR